MLVNEIFSSIEGEGIRTGYPVIFIRLYGCNLNCIYCDTQYSCEGKDYTRKSVGTIVNEVKGLGINRVTITGGEPLIHTDIELLVSELRREGFEVNIETNGSQDIYTYIYHDNVIITMDHKSISSGMNDKMNERNFRYLRPQDVLKFVVGNKQDLDAMKELLEVHKPNCNIFVSPIFGQIEPVEIVDYIKENKLNDCRVQLQLHKIIWDPKERGV